MNAQSKQGDNVTFTPISHASFVIQATATTICVDPVGDAKAYGSAAPAVILITDIHGDHLSQETVAFLKKENTSVIGPKAVVDKLGYGTIMNNGEKATFGKVTVEAIPMYNLTAERMKFHEKGRGNGYVVTLDGKRIYISGDTEDIPEMRALKNIDYAFVCMNLPYTMTPEQAASAVLEFKPKVAIPYHYRGSDINKFKEAVGKDKSIEVRFLKWYE
jgi:L-ascorbate metabolism protein UlaG (beta-lactamase superfamily)